MSDKRIYGDHFLTNEVRLQYVNVAKPDEGHENSSGKYSVRALIPKKKKADLKFVLDKVAEMYPGEDIDELDRHPLLDKKGKLRDGDEKKYAKFEGHEGCYFFNTLTDKQPDTFVVDADNGEPTPCDPNEIYPGCYARLLLAPSYAPKFDAVDFFLKAVVKTRDGERFKAGGTDSKSLITNWLGGASDATSTTKKVRPAAPLVTEDDDEDDAPPATKKPKPKLSEVEEAPKKKNREPEPEDDDDDEPPPAPKAKQKAYEEPKEKPKSKRSVSSLLDEDDDEDE